MKSCKNAPYVSVLDVQKKRLKVLDKMRPPANLPNSGIRKKNDSFMQIQAKSRV